MDGGLDSARARIGDRAQGYEYRNYDQDQPTRRNQNEIERRSYSIERLRRERTEYRMPSRRSANLPMELP